MSSRRRPLHTCGVSFLSVTQSCCSRAQDLDGSITRRIVRLVKLVSPLVFALLYQWLRVLAFIDDRFIEIAKIVEIVFPPSRLVFDKIDGLLCLIETFPGKFEDAVNKLPCFNQVQFLDWAVVHAISLLKFLIIILMNCAREGTREKEILIDINTETRAVDEKMKSDVVKRTYKEVLEMGTKPVEDDEHCKENEKHTYKEVKERGMREAMEDEEDCKMNERNTYKDVVEREAREDMEDEEDCKGNERRTYKDVMERGAREVVEYEEDCRVNERNTYKDVVELGARKALEDEEDCIVNEKETYKEVVEREMREVVKDGEDCKNGEKGPKVEEDTENCQKDETNQNQMAKMECGEKAEGKEKLLDQSYKGIISDKKGEKQYSNEKKNVEPGTIAEEQAAEIDYKYEENNGSMENEDEILELFETAWLMKPARKGKGSFLSR